MFIIKLVDEIRSIKIPCPFKLYIVSYKFFISFTIDSVSFLKIIKFRYIPFLSLQILRNTSILIQKTPNGIYHKSISLTFHHKNFVKLKLSTPNQVISFKLIDQ